MFGSVFKGRGEEQALQGEITETLALDIAQNATLEDGLRRLLDTVDGLVELDARVAAIEADLIGQSPIGLADLPSPQQLGMDGLVPRLMEAGLLIGAVTRRVQLRLGLIEGALGVRARPVEQPDRPLLERGEDQHDPAHEPVPFETVRDTAHPPVDSARVESLLEKAVKAGGEAAAAKPVERVAGNA